MSTSLLYHGLGIRGYNYKKTDFVKGGIQFTITQDRERLCCATCGSYDVHPRGSKPRAFKALPMGSKRMEILFAVPRVECENCGEFRQVKIQFADPQKSYTRGFERYALDLSKHMTIQDVATHLGVSWDLVKEIQKRSLHRKYTHPKLKHLRQIAIDEISIAKGHKYVTIVMDLKSGAVVFVGDGKDADALKPFWKRLRSSRAKIEAVAMDMGPAYIKAVTANLPDATIVFDHFHVIKLFNEKLTNLRRSLYRKATDEGKEVLKGIRFLLLKNPDNLKPEHDEEERLQAALDLNEPLSIAYYMKEELRQLWSQENWSKANAYLTGWIHRAIASGVRMLKNFAKTLETHRQGILAYYSFSISTGPLEGTNNKIKTMKRQAYGFRDHEFFKLKILGIHESKYRLVGG